MIVDRDTLDVKPIVDEIIKDEVGQYINEVSRGDIAWSNELVMHVIELKTNGPVPCLDGLSDKFQQEVREINRRLESYNACLMPTAMHPWMDPIREMKLWPHEYNPIYESYNRIFDCRGHGWANLQSTHINLPFANDKEFERLHAAIRILLPILPALSASSPIAEGKIQDFADYRLEVYRTNAERIPSITGYIIPEAVFNYEDYDHDIFQRMYRDIAPYDPENILQDEWLNSRGAIARFDRGSIEIRVLDIQECPKADLAIVRLIRDTLKALMEERWISLADQKKWNEKELYHFLMSVAKEGDQALLKKSAYTELFGFHMDHPISAGELWNHIFSSLYGDERIAGDPILGTMKEILEVGTLSGRIRQAITGEPTKAKLHHIYKRLCKCLEDGVLFKV